MSTTSRTLREASLACGNPYGVRSSTASTHVYILTQELYEGGRIGIFQHCAVRTIAAAA
jgi:hypothetical protein